VYSQPERVHTQSYRWRFGSVEIPIPNSPVYNEAILKDLLEPTTEVVIGFIYRAANGHHVFCSRTLPTVTIDKIVMALGVECTGGWVTGSMTTTTSKSPGKTITTMRMIVTINDVMPQGTETRVEEVVGNNIGNKGTWGQK